MGFDRSCGLLLHPTSLPGPYGIGDLGPSAHRYVEWLSAAGVGWWQVLPLGPTGAGNSPYSGTSTFAGNVIMASPDALLDDGLLHPSDLVAVPSFVDHTVDYERVLPFKEALLDTAFGRVKRAGLEGQLEEFRGAQRSWLDDYCLFASLKKAHGGAPWWAWPPALAGHEEDALRRWASAHGRDLERFAFRQLVFHRQWTALHEKAADAGVSLLGDMPIFVARDSADVWSHPELFLLDEKGAPTEVAGVPPDYFSKDGQLWGNPLYDWDRLGATGDRWWIDRLAVALARVDALRIDHFRGFVACWAVPFGAATARDGRWLPGPGRRVFDAAAAELGDLPLLAEDLGTITPDVIALKETLGLPGMAVLQFAFDPIERSTFLPYNHVANLVVYTGTHDNNTTVGWWMSETNEAARSFVRAYTGSNGEEINWELVRLAMGSVADLAMVPHQDVAGLGGDCRMNVPGEAGGNWRFRLTDWMLSDALRDRLAALVHVYGRERRPGPSLGA